MMCVEGDCSLLLEIKGWSGSATAAASLVLIKALQILDTDLGQKLRRI